MAENVVELNDGTFAEHIKEGHCLVDFWAPWCGPCKSQTPIIESIATKMGDKLKVAKLNVEEAQQTATKFGVMSIPTLIIFKDGQEVKRFVGFQSEDVLLEALQA